LCLAQRFIVGQLVLYPVALMGAWALTQDKPAAEGITTG